MKKAFKYLIGAGAAVLTGTLAAITTRKITETFVGTAIDREGPKPLKSVIEKFVDEFSTKEPYSSTLEAREKLKKTPMPEIKITADDGVPLVGHWYKAENPKRIIIAMHGWRSSWNRDFGAAADFWHQSGCSVLFAEQRAQGNSGGEYMTLGVSEKYDCLNWIKWVMENTEDLPVYLVGLSMGATTVLMASGFDLPDRVHGIIADCGFTSGKAILQHVAKNILHISYKFMHPDLDTLCREKTNVEDGENSTVEALKKNKKPVLFIHGTDDSFVPVSMTYENYLACNSEKYLFVVPGADHGASYLIDKSGYEKNVLEFFAKYDN